METERALLYLFITFIAVMVFFMGFGIWIAHQTQVAKDKACELIGFKDYTYSNSYDSCEDYDYNIHFIKMITNDTWFGSYYKAVPISIGDVRGYLK